MILITGGTGLTGSFITEDLQRRGQAVRVLARAESRERARSMGVDVAEGDLTRPDSLRDAMKGVAGVVHAACTFTDSRIDIAAMEALLDEWHGGPFIFISSLDVYGYARTMPITEAHPLDESYNDYARGKIICERALEQKAKATGRTDYAILRAPYIWGPHPKPRERLMTERLRQGQPIVLPGATEAEWSTYRDVWIDVRDLAWIVAESVHRPAGGPLNVLSGHFTWHELYQHLIRLTGSTSSIVHRPLATITDEEQPKKVLYSQTWRFSDDRLSQQMNFRPRFSLAETLEATMAAP